MSEQKKHDICVMLKTGANINMRVSSAKVNTEKLTGNIVAFEFNGCDTAYPLYIDLKQVAAVVQRLPGPTPYSCAGCRWEGDPSCCCHGGKGFEPVLNTSTGNAQDDGEAEAGHEEQR